MKFHNRSPIYQQVLEYVSGRIISGEWPGGQRIPSVRELSSQILVNTNTIQRVYQIMEEADVIYSQRGIGRFVCQSEEVLLAYRSTVIQEKIGTFLEDMKGYRMSGKELLVLIENALVEQEDKNATSCED